jgi:hypothetical protein
MAKLKSGGSVEITRTSPFSNKTKTIDIPITQEQYAKWQSGELIQNVMPELDADLREFLISGIIPGEWEEYLGSEKD